MHIFDPDLSVKANWQCADDIAVAAWDLAGHDHREEFRNSGKLPARSAWLEKERIRSLTDELADGQLVALGMLTSDPSLEFREIPQNLFLSAELQIDPHNSAIAGLGREFSDVRICRAAIGKPAKPLKPNSSGRPSLLTVTKDAWDELKSTNPNFLNTPKSAQNIEIMEKVAALFPAQYPGQSRMGDSTIRRHRREHPDLFI